MLGIKLIVVGSLKEGYLREAVAEYEKRLAGFCRLTTVQIKEERLPEKPSEAEIKAALDREAELIMAQIPQRSYRIALCVEGKSLSSPQLADILEEAAREQGEVCMIIGSSYGLSERVKKECRLRLSVSALTFPHQLMRVILLEAVYRALNIQKGTRYHK